MGVFVLIHFISCLACFKMKPVLLYESLLVSQIIRGNNASGGLYPYQVSLRKSKTNVHFCGKAIISKNYIITAAHCFNHFNDPSDLLVAFGSNYLNTPRAAYPAAVFIRHPNFNENTINDIGLIRVLKDIEFNQNIQPIALPTTDRNYDGYSILS